LTPNDEGLSRLDIVELMKEVPVGHDKHAMAPTALVVEYNRSEVGETSLNKRVCFTLGHDVERPPGRDSSNQLIQMTHNNFGQHSDAPFGL
jgi:hypothetical protein